MTCIVQVRYFLSIFRQNVSVCLKLLTAKKMKKHILYFIVYFEIFIWNSRVTKEVEKNKNKSIGVVTPERSIADHTKSYQKFTKDFAL